MELHDRFLTLATSFKKQNFFNETEGAAKDA